MSGNTEPTSNSVKFAPMPMSELLANLLPLHSQEYIPDCSFNSGNESDNSIGETVSNKPSPVTKIQTQYGLTTSDEFVTPNVKSKARDDIKSIASEKKSYNNDHDKENNNSFISNQTYPNKDSHVQSSHKNAANSIFPSSEVKNRNILMPHNSNKSSVFNNVKSQMSVHKKTPEMVKLPNSGQKSKISTPKIKSGIRKFTPGSARKSQQKKTPQKLEILQKRDKVRCELFTPQQKDKSSHSMNPPRVEQAKAPAPETPMNRKPMSSSYVATPSHPQGIHGNNSKILFKTISIKDKKYMFIKKLGTGGSSEVYKVSAEISIGIFLCSRL